MTEGPAPHAQPAAPAPGGAVLTILRQGDRIVPRLALPAALPLERMLIGKPAAEAAALMPRLFSLCKMAQETAACLTLGLAVPDRAALAAEVLRDHLILLCATLPRAAGLAPRALPADPAAFLFGPAGRLPETPQHLLALAAQHPVLDKLVTFAPGEATTPRLRRPTPETVFAGIALENSPAGRQQHRPLLRTIQALWGRGPLWRFAGILADAEAALHDRLPEPQLRRLTALVPAARGSYALRLATLDGRVASVRRATPTDHILACNGALLSALSTLPAAKSSLAPLVLALHDPCIPVALKEAGHA